MNSTLKSLVFWMILVVVGALVWSFSNNLNTGARQISFTEFMSYVNDGDVAAVTIRGSEITGQLKTPENGKTVVVANIMSQFPPTPDITR